MSVIVIAAPPKTLASIADTLMPGSDIFEKSIFDKGYLQIGLTDVELSELSRLLIMEGFNISSTKVVGSGPSEDGFIPATLALKHSNKGGRSLRL